MSKNSQIELFVRARPTKQRNDYISNLFNSDFNREEKLIEMEIPKDST